MSLKYINPSFDSLRFCSLPFISSLPNIETLSGINKVILGILILSIIILWCLINIIGYFGSLYILKYTEIETKYPRFKKILRFYEKSNKILLIIEIVFVLGILLFIILMCLHLLYITNV